MDSIPFITRDPVRRSRPAARQLVAARRIRRWDIDVQRAQGASAGIPDLVRRTALAVRAQRSVAHCLHSGKCLVAES